MLISSRLDIEGGIIDKGTTVTHKLIDLLKPLLTYVVNHFKLDRPVLSQCAHWHFDVTVGLIVVAHKLTGNLKLGCGLSRNCLLVRLLLSALPWKRHLGATQASDL